MHSDQDLSPEEEQKLQELEELLRQVDELKPSIRRSNMAEAEKLKFLTLIDTGAFCLNDFDELLEAMDTADQQQLKQAEMRVLELEQQEKRLQTQVAELRVQSALEMTEKLEKLEQAMLNESKSQ